MSTEQQPEQQAAQDTSPNNKPRNRTWDENYAELLTFKAMHGHCNVPLNNKNDRILGKWVAHLRENGNQTSLSEERRQALNAIGFNWSPHDAKWVEMFERLAAFKAVEGHTKVPTNWKTDRKLGKWVMRQREKRKNGILQQARLEKLESIGFVWKVHKVEQNKEKRKTQHIDEKWQTRYQQLVKFHEETGHCNVPKIYDPDPSLGKWVQEQRVTFQRNLLKPERKKLLEDIGFVFSYRAQKIQQDWNQMYEQLKQCSETTPNGQFKVTVTDGGLMRWVQRQKEAYKNYRLDPGREVLLRKINFQFPDRLEIKNETEPTTLATHPFGILGTAATAEQFYNDAAGVGMPGLAGAQQQQQPLLLGHPASIAAHLAPLNSTRQKRPVGVSGGLAHVRGQGASAVETDKQLGMKVADGIDLLAKCMGITPLELAKRMAVPSTATSTTSDSSEKPAAKPKSPGKRKKGGDDGVEDEAQTEQVTPPQEILRFTPRPVKNLFSQLLPKIVEIREHVARDQLESVQRDCCKYLESFVRKEKGWDPRPCEGDTYNRMLALATELGVLLDHRFERCQSVVQSCERYFDTIVQKAKKSAATAGKGNKKGSANSDKATATDDGDNTTTEGPDDSVGGVGMAKNEEDAPDMAEPPAKRLKTGAPEDTTTYAL